MKMTGISALLLMTGAMVAGFAGCGDDTTNGTGGNATTSSSTGTTTTGATSTSGTGTQDNFLGQECDDDGDCNPNGGICIRSAADDLRLGGGPPNGYCSKPCTSSTECGTGNYCWEDASGNGMCFLGCEIGEPELMYINSPLDDAKCHGREDLRCDSIEDIPVCVPTCGSDSQCGGRVCDIGLSVCVDTPGGGLPNGAQCDQANDMCAGVCVNFNVVQMCSSYCVLGGEITYPDCGGLDQGLCAYTATDPYGAGDIGLCAKACLSQSECINPLTWCFGVGNLTGPIIPNGFCFSARACPNGQADCPAGGDDICTDTPAGPLCLDPLFPVDGGGGAGGGGTGGAGGAGGAGTGGGTGGTGG